MTYAHAIFKVATTNSLGEDALTRNALFDPDLGVKITQNVAQYPLHHVTYAHAIFKVATTNSLGEDALTRNALFDPDLGVKITGKVVQYPLH